MTYFYVLLILGIAVVILYLITLYNRFIRLDNQAAEGWSGISVQLKRRYDLIPNLVECVKAYMAHERETLEALIEKRNEALKGEFPEEEIPEEITLPENKELIDSIESIETKRKAAMDTAVPKAKALAEDELRYSLRTLFALSENYPNLKADRGFIQLQITLGDIEDAIQLARRYYNATVRNYNTAVETFPANIIAKHYSFVKKEFFSIDDNERENVRLNFS